MNDAALNDFHCIHYLYTVHAKTLLTVHVGGGDLLSAYDAAPRPCIGLINYKTYL